MKGNGIDVNELKKIQLEILQEVHDFCTGNGITYFLSSGTLIGAVRHGGYIPWDDDIDIYMPRTDYDRFIASYNNGDGRNTKVRALTTDRDYYYPYAKVEDTRTRLIEKTDSKLEIGINIDVFPLDGVPDDQKERVEYFNEIDRLRHMAVLKSVSVDWKRRGAVKNLILIISKIILAGHSQRRIAEKLDSRLRKNLLSTEYVCNMPMGNGLKSCFKRKACNSSIAINFEGRQFMTMSGYDEYLTATYGNYMKLPPENQRVSHHAFEAYWK